MTGTRRPAWVSTAIPMWISSCLWTVPSRQEAFMSGWSARARAVSFRKRSLYVRKGMSSSARNTTKSVASASVESVTGAVSVVTLGQASRDRPADGTFGHVPGRGRCRGPDVTFDNTAVSTAALKHIPVDTQFLCQAERPRADRGSILPGLGSIGARSGRGGLLRSGFRFLFACRRGGCRDGRLFVQVPAERPAMCLWVRCRPVGAHRAVYTGCRCRKIQFHLSLCRFQP